jgi:proteasome-associated ATPase
MWFREPPGPHRPAILRPGLLDVKVRVERPDMPAATEIFAKYLTVEVPIAAARSEENRFASGAMIESIVRRAKTLALKRYIANGPKGVTTDDLLSAVREEFRENEDLPNTTNPDDWAKIAGRKAERIISVKTLTNGAPSQPRNVERVVATGQYL